MIIDDESSYRLAITQLEQYLEKGFTNLKAEEAAALQNLSLTIAAYEKQVHPVARPQTLAEMIELRMYQRKINQKQLAELMEVSPSKLSQILSNKREPDLAFLKNCKHKLAIPSDFILDFA
jgi:HTH-type transcriptional regulator/antitoxin HigA